MRRFWSKVNKDGPVPSHKPELGNCWVWTASLTKGGYGRILWSGKATGAHRISFLIEHGSITEGAQILHKCDNPKCVKPTHLYEGSVVQNMQDRSDANRTARHVRETNGRVKVTPKQVEAMRELSSLGVSKVEIIKILDLPICRVQVGRIVNRKQWL